MERADLPPRGDPVVELVQEEGRVVGVVVEREGRTERIGARRAVFLGAGGFARNAEMRRMALAMLAFTRR